MTILWILKKTKNGKLVEPPEGVEGFNKKNIKEALRDYHERYPRSTFVACKQIFKEVKIR